MRRAERAVTDPEEINNVLRTAEICRLGLPDGDMAYIVPMNFGYADRTIYFHSSPDGKKIDILRRTGCISFEVDKLIDIETGEKACDWSAYYISVMGDGNAEFVDGPEEKIAALNLIMEKYSGKSNWTFDERTLSRTLIFKLIINNISCKAAYRNTGPEAENSPEL